jgi:Transcriptional regulator containing PAS, AAA-type ATPase, and DNA-binding domains
LAGNVRELHNVIEQVSWLTPPGELVTADLLPPMVRGGGTMLTPTRERRRRLSDELFRMITEEGYTFWEPIHGYSWHAT